MRKLFKRRFVAFTLLSVGAFSAHSAVWNTNKQWNNDEEKKYSEWVQKEWHTRVFSDTSSPYYGFITDCADAGYTMRMIYAYENNLPFKIYSRRLKRTLSNSMRKYDNPTLEQLQALNQNLDYGEQRRAERNWDNYDTETKKLFLFQRLINSITSTWSLPQDTYAPKMGKGNIVPGQVILQRRYHTYTIQDIDQYGVLQLVNSTTPPEVRTMGRATDYQAYPRYLYEEGALAFRWPEEAKLASHRVRRGSSQQFTEWNKIMTKILKDAGQYEGPRNIPKKNSDYNQLALREFKKLLKFGNGRFSGLSEQEEPFEMKITRKVNELCQYVRERVEVVNGSLELQDQLGGSCMNAAQYDNHSTPSRDGRIVKMYNEIITDYNESDDSDRRNLKYSDYFYKFKALYEAKAASLGQSTRYFGDYNICSINYGDSRYDSVQLDVFMSRLLAGRVMYDPNSSQDQRWGEEEYTARCQQY